MANGVTLYEGPSMLDGKPIAVIATGIEKKTRNTKMGDMVQVWILRSDLEPIDAIKSGDDVSICGDCVHRGTGDGKDRSCYVAVKNAPLSVFRAYQKGLYIKASDPNEIAASVAGRMVRFGAYGDPAAAPLWVWQALASSAQGWTGYTHQWRTFPGLKRYCMASADSATDRDQAKAEGWRVFRVRDGFETLGKREIVCPASDEGGKRTACDSCRLCAGSSIQAADVAIIVHGSKAKTNAYARNVA